VAVGAGEDQHVLREAFGDSGQGVRPCGVSELAAALIDGADEIDRRAESSAGWRAVVALPDFERVVSTTRHEHPGSHPPFRLLYTVTYQARTSSP
jgi:hypothetical protein